MGYRDACPEPASSCVFPQGPGAQGVADLGAGVGSGGFLVLGVESAQGGRARVAEAALGF